MKTAGEKPTVSPGKSSRTALPADPSQSKSRSAAVPPSVSPPSESAGSHWTFLTNHTHVLVVLSRNPSLVLRAVALQVGITERAVQRIIADLEASGIIDREKIGRQNHYRIQADQPLRHHNESHRTIGELLALLNGAEK
jgi:predicted transcriptional regulator